MNEFCYLISNISLKTRRDSIWKAFEEFGNIKQMQMFSQDDSLSAVIVFVNQPFERMFLSPVYIEKSQVTVKQIRFAEYMGSFTSPVSANKLSFGGLSMPTVFIEEWSTNQYITFDANLNEKYLEIFFAHMEGYYRLRIYYNESIESMLVLQRHNDITSLMISAKYPPHFWRSKIPMEELTNHYDLHDWERVTEIPVDDISRDIIRHKLKTNGKNRDPITPYGEYPDDMMQLNLWTVYRIEFNVPLRSFRTPNADAVPETSHETLENKIWAIKSAYNVNIPRNLKIPEIRTQLPTSNLKLEKQFDRMPFEVRYMMEHAFNLKILREYNVEADFFDKMIELPPSISCTFLSLLSAPQERIYNPDTHINHIYQLCKNQIAFQIPVPDNCFLLRRVIITPTSMYPLQPTIEPMNQLQTKYKDHADRFLYVEFTDEDLTPIKPVPDQQGNYNNTDSDQNGKIYDRVYSILRRGIRIAGRAYEFVGTSLKDLKSHSCWFFSSTEALDRNTILKEMGEFKDVQTVAKFTNYTGLVFMPRLMDLTLNTSEIEEIEDFIDDYGHNFTDECGKMSPQIAREIARELNLDHTPSVVQFNLCGFKGILMLSNYLTGRKIQLRTSQFKFESTNLTMSISKYSKNNKVYLDWHTITILSSLGVRYHYFEEILQEEIHSYEKPSQKFTKAYSHIFDNQYYLRNDAHDFRHIMSYGSITPKEPFVSNFLTSLENKRLKELKEDCKIYVNDATKVFAIMDETSTLARNEVFLQVINDESMGRPSRQVIQGQCVVYRDTSCFPGDVRVFNAIDHPKLRHYTNVLVFSNADLVDLPNLCSNDEPDQDNFTVIWDSRLLPTEYNLAQRKYVSNESPSNLRKVSFLEAAKFFTTFISKDIYAVLKEAYIAIADKAPNGIFHGNCNYLAKQLCHSIDFARTGVYASLSGSMSSYAYPNFMQQEFWKSYTSRKPLGYLYELLQTVPYKSLISNYCMYDHRLHIEGMYKYILEARKTKAKYDYSLRLILGRYSIKSEIELVSGNIVDWPKYINPHQRDEFTGRAQAAFSRFRNYWRQEFYAELVRMNVDPDDTKSIHEKAAAWYYVTYHPSEFKNDVIYNSTLKRYLSFPWTVDEYITEIAMQNNDRVPLQKHVDPVSAEKIQECAKIHMQNQNIIVYESDDDEEESSEEESSEEEEEEAVYNQDISREVEQVAVNHVGNMTLQDSDEEDVPVVNVRLADLAQEAEEESEEEEQVPIVNVRLADLM